MSYNTPSHKRDKQVKVRLNDHQLDELKEYAVEIESEHSVLAYEIILAALEFKREHGYLPMNIRKKSRA